MDILKKYGLTEEQLERLLVAHTGGEIKPLQLQLGGEKTYTFAAIADTHLCSKEERLRELHTFYEICRQRGVRDVYHCGDLVSGQSVYRGQAYEVHTFGCDNQVEYFVNKYPKVKEITTHFILGNHDYSYYQEVGVDVGKRISERRSDMDYRGVFSGDVFLDGIRLIRMVHPQGGMPYAISYRAQKYVEQIPSGKSKPRILLFGHLHTCYQFFYRNIAVFGCGCFEGQTTLLARMGINPVIGGWLITIKFGKDKRQSIVSIVPEFVPFYV